MLIHTDCLFFFFSIFQSFILLFGCYLELHFLQTANVNKLAQEKNRTSENEEEKKFFPVSAAGKDP